MKKSLQQADEKQELVIVKPAGTDLNRTKRIGYLSFQRQRDPNSTHFVRNIRETFESATAKDNGLKNGDNFHRSNSVRSTSSNNGDGNCSGEISVDGVTEVSNSPVVNIKVSISSSDDSGDGRIDVENVGSEGYKANSSPAFLSSEHVAPEKAQDRLAKSQSYIEQLQQNLATKLSSATVEAFRQDYSPALGRRSHRNSDSSLLNDSTIDKERNNCGDHNISLTGGNQGDRINRGSDSNAVSPSLPNSKQVNDRSNRQSRVGKEDNSVPSSKRRKLLFLNGIFSPSLTKPTRRSADFRKNDITPVEAQGNNHLEASSAAHLVENDSLKLENKEVDRNVFSSGSHVEVGSKSCGDNDVNPAKVIPGQNVDKAREGGNRSGSSSSSTPPGEGNNLPSDKHSDARQQNIRSESEESVKPAPPSKPPRVSWTTRLIQKLTEEEVRKKNKPQIKVEKPRRIVRFPQKKLPKVDKQEKLKVFEENKKQPESAHVLHRTTEVPANKSNPSLDCKETNTKDNPSGIILDESRDAYASLISQLSDTPDGGKGDQRLAEVKGEDLILNQTKLEETRAALAREECPSTSSDDDSVCSAAITASTGSIEAGRGKEPKPSGIRRLLPQGLFAHKHRQIDRRDEIAVLEPLLKRGDVTRVYPAPNPARPVLETAFLSDLESKLSARSGFHQQQRSQSSSPASRQKQASPRARSYLQESDQAIIQDNEQNSSRINQQARSKSLSPSRDRRGSATSPTAKRTIPDTSLILEERLRNIRKETSSPPGADVRRPSSATPTDRHNKAHQRQDSLPSSPARARASNKAIQQEPLYQNSSRQYNGAPSDAYYHSPPSRRRQQNKAPQNDSRVEDHLRKVSGGSSASSTSTIVAESPSDSLSWNPLLLNLENQAISGSPDIRKLQQQRQQQRVNEEAGLYGEIRNGARRDYRDLVFSRTDSPDIYYHPNSGLTKKPQGLIQVHYGLSQVQVRSPTSVPSGRLSAPPVASYYIEDYPRRRVISPEPARSRQEHGYEPSSKRSVSQPPRLRQQPLNPSPRPSFQPVNSNGRRMVLPVTAQVKISSSPQSRPKQEDNVNSKETQTARSYVQQQYRQLAAELQSTPQGQNKKLSRQEIEALYWETQKLRQGLASLSHQFQPQAPKLGERYPSTASLPQQLSPAYRNALRSEQSSPMSYQSETSPRQPFRTQSALNVGGGYGSLIVRPQPIYNNIQQYSLVKQAQTTHDANLRVPRARSVSPGANSNRHLTSRSLSLPRSVPVDSQPPRKVSNDPANYFVRGVPQRNTIGPIRTSQHSPQIRQQSTPTIYEEPTQGPGVDYIQLGYAELYKNANEVGDNGNKINNKASSKSTNNVEANMSRNSASGDGNISKKSGSGKRNKKSSTEQSPSPQQGYHPPIFKRGSLISTSTCSVDAMDGLNTPKRVSFTSNYTDEPLYWPTRNGPAPEPPTRQHKLHSVDSDVFLPSEEYSSYVNVPQAPNRPLPPVPRDVNGAAYGIVTRKSRDSKSPASGFQVSAQRWQQQSESESGSEAGEVQRILQQGSHGHGMYFRFPEEEWGADGKARGPPGTEQSGSNVGRDEEVRRGGGGGGRSGRRDEPRRHTLSGDHHHHQQGGALARSMDLESPLPRGYPPPSTAMLFDDDPGIMSEVETSSTGFRRGGKQRSSLPVVRTPSKTLERPLGKTSGAGVPIGVGPMLRISPHPSAMATHHHQMVQLLNHHHGLSNKQSSATATSGGLVFLQYRSETKRALLPNEITSIDTVKALFVRSFPKQLTMEYLDSPHVKIYIHDSSKDMFYELEDLRSHLRDIRDRSVLRLFESTDMNGGVLPGAGVGVVAPPIWDQDQSYFSEPEFDSEYQHQHIHKSKASSKSGSSGGVPPQAPYYMTHSYPPAGTQGAPGASATLPRGGPLLRAYSPAVAPPVPADRIKTLPQTDRLHAESGYMSSPERGGPRAYPAAAYPPGGQGYEDPYYSQYASRSGSITPVIDEEARIRVEHMERQLANLTGLVQKALTQTPTPREYLQVPPPASARDANYRNDDSYLRTDTKPPKLGKDKSVSFEKSVSFSDEPPDMNSPKQHSPQHAERTERDRHKPAPPPKPVSLSPGQYEGRHVYRDMQLTPEMYNQLRGLQKKAKDLRQEVRNLRRMSQAQAHSVRETIRDTFMKIRAMLLIGGEEAWAIAGDADKVRLNREEDSYKQEMLRLEKDLTELESTVEELRGNVINRKTRVNMSDVENMALILSKSSKTVADLKVRFPSLQEGMKGLLSSEMEKVVREEKFLKEEPERLESALRRCKKLTGTLVTLKRLASVQEQRLPPSLTPESRLSPTMGLGGDSDTPITPPAHGKPSAIPARGVMAPTIGGDGSASRQRPENALDALLDELQTFARPPSRAGSGHNPPMADIGRKGSIDSAHPHAPSLPSSTGTSSLRRLHSYPSSSDGGGNSPPTVALARLQVSGNTGADAPKSPATSPKPPVPERNSELLSHLAGRRVPPPPPPRTSSRSPLASPTSPSLPPRGQHPPSQPQMGVGGGTLLRRGGPGRSSLREPLRGTPGISVPPSTAMAKQEDPNQPQPGFNPLSASNSSSCESINSQEGLQQNKAVSTSSSTGNKARQEILEQRHQELLRKQRALQEQYARLQQLQRGGGGGLTVVPPPDLLLKKTGSESNLLAKMGLGHGLSAAAPISGSLTHLAAVAASANQQPIMVQQPQKQAAIGTTPATTTTNTQSTTTTTNKIYETDIL